MHGGHAKGVRTPIDGGYVVRVMNIGQNQCQILLTPGQNLFQLGATTRGNFLWSRMKLLFRMERPTVLSLLSVFRCIDGQGRTPGFQFCNFGFQRFQLFKDGFTLILDLTEALEQFGGPVAVGVDFRIGQLGFHFCLFAQKRFKLAFQPGVGFLLRADGLVQGVALFRPAPA